MRGVHRATILGSLLAVTALASPAFGQISLVGDWGPRTHEDQRDRGPGPMLGDYTGIPVNERARRHADSWDASRMTIPEHQCKVHVVSYIFHGPMAWRIWEEKDPVTQRVVAIKQWINTYEQERTIWMDGRQHPPEYVPHTWMGFSTGRWEGDVLVVSTTHIKSEWFRRNGVPNSDKTTLLEYYIRHGNRLTHVTVAEDPAFLSEPWFRSRDFTLQERAQGNWLWPCEYVEEVARPKDEVPHFLPGTNSMLAEFPAKTGIPAEAARGGAETLYPEYRVKLRSMASASNDSAAR